MRCNVKVGLLVCLVSFYLSAYDLPGQNSDNAMSPELVSYVLTEAFEVIDFIEQLGEDAKNKVGVLCSGCQKMILVPAELAGHLCIRMDQENLDILKELLREKNVEKINAFILAVAQEKQFACSLCRAYAGWIELPR